MDKITTRCLANTDINHNILSGFNGFVHDALKRSQSYANNLAAYSIMALQ
jgi:hypothetical protein